MKLIKTRSFELAVNTAGDPKSPKLAIVIPGRLDTKDYANNVSHIQYLASLGYFALSFDPPGTWESPGGIEIYNTTNYIKAVNELIELFGNKQTLLFGHSRGGTIAMLVGTVNPIVTHIVAAMSYYGPPSEPTLESRKRGYQISLRDLPPGTTKDKNNQKRFELPIAYFEDGSKYNAKKNLISSHIPKLFFYGTDDIDTPEQDIREMYEFSSEPKFIHALKSDHDYRRKSVIIKEVNEVVGEFLNNTYLKKF